MKGWIVFILTVAAISILGVEYIPNIQTLKSDVAQVKEVKWITTTNAYEKKLVHSSQWSFIPKGGFNGRCVVKERGTSFCFCKDGKNYQGCQRCPVSDIYCEYDRYVWSLVESQDLEGNDYALRWPEIVVVGSNQKAEARIVFKVLLKTNNGEEITYYPINFYDFKNFSVGSWWKYKRNTLGHIKPIRLVKSNNE